MFDSATHSCRCLGPWSILCKPFSKCACTRLVDITCQGYFLVFACNGYANHQTASILVTQTRALRYRLRRACFATSVPFGGGTVAVQSDCHGMPSLHKNSHSIGTIYDNYISLYFLSASVRAASVDHGTE